MDKPKKQKKRSSENDEVSKSKKQKIEKISTKPSNNETKQESKKDRTIFVGGLGADVTSDDLQSLFENFGKIESIKFVWKNKQEKIHKGVAFVQYTSSEEANEALQKNGQKLKGRVLDVRMETEKKVKVHQDSVTVLGVPFDSTEENVKNHFKNCGTIQDIFMPERDGNPSGKAFIKFRDEAGAEKALALSGSEIDSRIIRVEFRKKRVTPKDDAITIFNIPSKTTTDTLKDHFDQCGEIKDVYIPLQGKSVGTAWVTFKNSIAVENALTLAGTTIDGQAIRVEVRKQKGQVKSKGQKKGGRNEKFVERF